ncbi:MAG: hypothetical protein LBS99_05955, partial [Clostridiales bacterium]|nr:hypothetical protein [Clostridiales bacterium]
MKIIADTELNVKNKASAVSGRMTQIFAFVMGAFFIGMGIWLATGLIPSLGIISIVAGVALLVLGCLMPKIMAKTVAKAYARENTYIIVLVSREPRQIVAFAVDKSKAAKILQSVVDAAP